LLSPILTCTTLLDAIPGGGDIDVLRRGVAFLLQALIDAEATAPIGTDRFERTSWRTTQRNGTRERLLSTKAGDVDLKIPKLCQDSFFPPILERRRRIDRALFTVIMEANVHGVSTSTVDDLVAALGLEVPGQSHLHRARRRARCLPFTLASQTVRLICEQPP
jgi:transposase-like protein